MEILRTITLYTETKAIPFMVIGGHAVNAYGISRQTGDIDLLVKLTDRTSWLELMSKLNYSPQQNDERFARFRPKSIAAWPIDLMFVDDETFEKMYAESIRTSFGLTDAQLISVRHLIILKIHSLKYYQEHRHARDYGDLLSLLRSGNSNLPDEELKELCRHYADIKLYTRIHEDLESA
jgi:hypothetical protein